MQLETMYSIVEGRLATIVLNRPDVLNCANEQVVRDLNVLIDSLIADERIRVVVVRAAGAAFCTGIDLTALSTGHIGRGFFRGWEEALRKLETMDAMVVAAIHSHCIGGGLQLALACDLRVARDDSRFGVTAVREGIVPGMGMWRIARHAGAGRAKRLALAADVVDARTALAWGLVDYVADADSFDDTVARVRDRLLDMAWTSTRLTKKLVNMAFDTSWAECLEVFCECQSASTRSEEHQHAMAERRELRAARLART
jgi:enoyl-CoA hydratase/carnithine racemase